MWEVEKCWQQTMSDPWNHFSEVVLVGEMASVWVELEQCPFLARFRCRRWWLGVEAEEVDDRSSSLFDWLDMADVDL